MKELIDNPYIVMIDIAKKVYEEIVKSPNIIREELSEKLGVTVKTTSRTIQVLKDGEKIKRTGSKKNGTLGNN